jgi:hypothetical protein
LSKVVERMKEREAQLPVSELRRLFKYCPVGGELWWKWRDDVRRQWNTQFAGTLAGTLAPNRAIHIAITLHGERLGVFFAHRIAWALWHGEWPKDVIDHENGDERNNWIGNLRQATIGENLCNRRAVEGTVPYRGVYFNVQRGKFAAQIKKDKKWHWLGLFDTAEDAAEAYDKAAVRLHGKFAATNKQLKLLLHPDVRHLI